LANILNGYLMASLCGAPTSKFRSSEHKLTLLYQLKCSPWMFLCLFSEYLIKMYSNVILSNASRSLLAITRLSEH